MKTKLIISDIDGVWTDGGMYYFNNGEEAKKFNTSDSVGVSLANIADIEIIIISGEDIPALRNRLNKLKIMTFFLGVNNKFGLVEELIKERKIGFDEVAFIGDEINDHPLLKQVGFSGCPNSAPNYTKRIVNYITESDGGKGAFRDFVLEVLNRENKLEFYFNKLVSAKYL